MWQKLSKRKKSDFLNKWIVATLKVETKLSLKRHIVRHAGEVYKKEPEEWIASMKNLIDAFELINNINTGLDTRLKKLNDKYIKNPKRYTPPPKI